MPIRPHRAPPTRGMSPLPGLTGYSDLAAPSPVPAVAILFPRRRDVHTPVIRHRHPFSPADNNAAPSPPFSLLPQLLTQGCLLVSPSTRTQFSGRKQAISQWRLPPLPALPSYICSDLPLFFGVANQNLMVLFVGLQNTSLPWESGSSQSIRRGAAE